MPVALRRSVLTPVQGRRDGLSDYLEDDESHGIAPFESETDKFLVSIVGRYDL